MITVELRALRLFGRHGVHAHEKRDGQEFVFDVDLAVGERGTSDRLEDAVDYRDVARTVQEVSRRSQRTSRTSFCDGSARSGRSCVSRSRR